MVGFAHHVIAGKYSLTALSAPLTYGISFGATSRATHDPSLWDLQPTGVKTRGTALGEEHYGNGSALPRSADGRILSIGIQRPLPPAYLYDDFIARQLEVP